jgi:hypothetical protein
MSEKKKKKEKLYFILSLFFFFARSFDFMVLTFYSRSHGSQSS